MEKTKVFEKYNLGDGLELRNHVVLAPLDMAYSRRSGQVTQRDLGFHRSRSRKVGLDVVGSAYVSVNGNTAPRSIGVYDDSMIPGLTKIADTIHKNGSKAILQLVHAGRATTPSATQKQKVVAPSAIAMPFGHFPVPEALDEREISKIMNQFIDAATRAEAAGFDGVELHGANSFLLQQFVSPVSNHRTDNYGGSLVKRLRFPVELVTRLKALIHSFDRPFALGYRLSPEELIEGGMGLIDTISLAKALDNCGITYLSLSLRNYVQTSGGATNWKGEKVVPLFKQAVNCPLMIAGSVNTAAAICDASQDADLVGVGTALMKDLHWLEKVRTELDDGNAGDSRNF